jgi:hypothetical protein
LTQLTLVGNDPGIKDTGAVALRLDTKAKTWEVHHQVWSDITSRPVTNRNVIIIDPVFERQWKQFVKDEEDNAPTFIGVEGYRQRGTNPKQDQEMLYMVQQIQKMIPGSIIVDNTGIKNVVTRDMLKLFGVARFRVNTNHSDLVSASRVALKVGISIPVLNAVLYQFILDNVEGEPWSLVSTSTQ